jgi:Xaa-Pro aminopeptidase
VRRAERNVLESASSVLEDAGAGSICVEESISVRQHRFVSERFSGELRLCGNWVEQLREVKEPAEVERIAEAQEITDACFTHVLSVLGVGRTEQEIALEIEFFLRRQGSEGVAFPAIVASGPNSAFPHAKVTDRAIESGDFVKMDFGARLGGYCADMTRTVVVGCADQKQRRVYEAVLAANSAGITAAKPGMALSAVDAAARTELAERGLGELFSHGLGHGVGLEVHELPGMGPNSTGSLREGSVVTVEPGVYEPGFGGVRIEDLVVVEERGARVLTRSPKHLIEL